jgi:hypothetical protein
MSTSCHHIKGFSPYFRDGQGMFQPTGKGFGSDVLKPDDDMQRVPSNTLHTGGETTF